MLTEQERLTLIDAVAQKISPKRLAHVLRVEQKAIELAKKYQVCIAECQRAALLHDYAKEWTTADYTYFVAQQGLDANLLSYGSNLLHGPVGARVAQLEFGVSQQVADAISAHTIGALDMSDVSKVLFIADFIEDGRDFDGVEQARAAAEVSLDEGVSYKIKHTLAYLIKQEIKIYPEVLTIYNAWVPKKGE